MVVFACAVLILVPGEMVTALASWPRGLLVSSLAPVSQLVGRSGLLAGEEGGDGLGGVRAPLAEGPALDYLRALEDENARLRTLVDELAVSTSMLTRPGATQVLARVLSVYEDDAGLAIGAGERSGLRAGDVVVVGEHLVGSLSGVAPLTSDVDLVARDGVRVQVRLVPATDLRPERESVEWFDYDEGLGAFVAELSLDAPVQVEDVAHLVDDRWPLLARGRVVGRVVTIDDRTSKPLLLKRVIVEPGYAVDRLRRVVVLTERAAETGSGGGS